jgi:hypothetical protein
VLQAQFAIVQCPTRFWDKETLIYIMPCCVILHNMILKDEGELNLPCFYNNVGTRVQPRGTPIGLKLSLKCIAKLRMSRFVISSRMIWSSTSRCWMAYANELPLFPILILVCVRWTIHYLFFRRTFDYSVRTIVVIYLWETLL